MTANLTASGETGDFGLEKVSDRFNLKGVHDRLLVDREPLRLGVPEIQADIFLRK